ncbi:MAG: transcription elongation factor GreA [Gammaproteobacteria bacterium]|jgi:transcription elongation factor GreA|nr:transcription elongation factor GreA [Gammaproteobacteria bacterium]HJL95997.1 transcription elongation factor GreA [SAR86 cluster bacterium]HJM59632.1 transcription elongation factor GreA [SAR86 cluster bacterium]|tara:strand:+ start:13248 stop:13718 length:471 start_codon:yes stop_codon:yes gene_type:complete
MNPMTVEGESLLREELKKLKNEERPRIIEAIATAREFGDLKENAEYHAAKEQQSLTEARIKDIEAKLSNSQVIDISKLEVTDKVIFGTTITLLNCKSEEISTYKIVGEDEADAKIGKISFASPLAKQIIGKFEGDVVKVEAPNGSLEYEIDNVEYI